MAGDDGRARQEETERRAEGGVALVGGYASQ